MSNLKLFIKLLISLAIWNLSGILLLAQTEKLVPPSARSYDNIPQGTVTKHSMVSDIYPNTVRDYYVYIPAQYDGIAPVALMVFQDGHTYIKSDGDFRAPTVFDNLIAQQKMPITIGLFINPGHNQDLPAPENPWRASNRSIEYDTVSDTYVRFLVEEMIPILSEDYRISDDPKMRAICGISSGGICAFTAAWQRPHVFHRVLSHIGSFTDIKGGHNYPPLIRKSEPKPIKVFLQDGTGDLDNQFGNWFLANQQMAKALEYQGYDYQFVTDTGAHNGVEAGLILPQSLIWLWQNTVPEHLESGKYGIDPDKSPLVFKGATTHLSSLECETSELTKNENFALSSDDHEQVIIVREGKCKVQNSKNGEEVLGPNSVVFIPQHDTISFSALSNAQLLIVRLQRRSGKNHPAASENQEAFVINFDSLTYRPHLKGGRFDLFRRSTAMFPYFEMHITNLNSGLQSHAAHTHDAEELIIMINGETEEEVGNALHRGDKNDIYYLGSNVPHSIRNVGLEPSMYFAFQWSIN